MAELNLFNDVANPQIQDPTGIAGQQYIDNMAYVKVGAGDQALQMDQSGLWLGARRFADAPFKVSMDGVMSFTSADGLMQMTSERIVFFDANGIPTVLIGKYP